MTRLLTKKRNGYRLMGFTLIETIVALGLITGGVAAATTLTLQVISNVAVSKNKLAALNLAQEGIEFVRQIRDTNEIKNNSWDQGITQGACSANYEIDLSSGAPTRVPNADRYLLYPDSKGLFGYDSGSQTIFKRVVTVEKPCAGSWGRSEVPDAQELRIISTVTWTERSAAKSVSLEEVLYDWK
jgi:type II secretory pathway pseudopilin PulG